MTAAAVARCEGRFRYPEVPPAGRATAPRGGFCESTSCGPGRVRRCACRGTDPDEGVPQVSTFGIFYPASRTFHAGRNLPFGATANNLM